MFGDAEATEAYYESLWQPIEHGKEVKIEFHLPPKRGRAGSAKTIKVKMPSTMRFGTIKKKVSDSEGILVETKLVYHHKSDNQIEEHLTPIDIDMDGRGSELTIVGTNTELNITFSRGDTTIDSVRLNINCPIYDAFKFGAQSQLGHSFTTDGKILLQESPPGWSGLPGGKRWIEIKS